VAAKTVAERAILSGGRTREFVDGPGIFNADRALPVSDGGSIATPAAGTAPVRGRPHNM
jgi:hypothetical protein